MSWDSLGAGCRSITEIPAIKKSKSLRISRSAPPKLHSQRGWAVIHIAGCDCSGRLVAGADIGNLVDSGVKIDIVKGAIDRMLGNTDDAADGVREITHTHRIIVHIKSN